LRMPTMLSRARGSSLALARQRCGLTDDSRWRGTSAKHQHLIFRDPFAFDLRQTAMPSSWRQHVMEPMRSPATYCNSVRGAQPRGSSANKSVGVRTSTRRPTEQPRKLLVHSRKNRAAGSSLRLELDQEVDVDLGASVPLSTERRATAFDPHVAGQKGL